MIRRGKASTKQTTGVFKSDGNIYITKRNKFASVAVLQGCRDGDIVKVEARSYFNVAAFSNRYPVTFSEIINDLERGYYTSADESIEAIHDMLYEQSHTELPIAFIGRAEMFIPLPNERAHKLHDEARAIRELLQQPMDIVLGEKNGNKGYYSYVSLGAKTRTERKETHTGRMKKIPVIDHCFQQVRPLVIQHLKETRDFRDNLITTWKERPTFSLYWS